MTICQVRDAASALLDALPLGTDDQKQRLSKAAKILRRTQERNAAARASHMKTRQARLRKLRINLAKLRCCIPSPSG